MDEITGSAALGFGFNAVGAYDPTSLMSRVFTKTFKNQNTYTYEPTKIQYLVPDNVSVIAYNPSQGRTQVYKSQYELQTHLSTLADISGSYQAFSGQIEGSFSNAVEEWGSIFYAVTDAWVGTWMVVLNDVSQSALEPEFVGVLNQLPNSFEASTLPTFFSFFQQYGTHFVHSVGAGGYFSYNEGVENSGSLSFTDVEVKVQLEYNAVFTAASATAQADWSQLGQQWVNDRTVTIKALGGDASALSDVAPVFGTTESSGFYNWRTSIESNPASVQFILRGWEELLPTGSPQQSAMKQALDSYMNYSIYVDALYDGNVGRTQIAVGGANVIPATSWPASPQSQVQGIEIILVSDTVQLPVTFSAVYYVNPDGSNAQQFFDQIMADLAGHADAEKQWCGFSVFNFPWGVLPDSRLLGWLQQFGITGAKWQSNYYNCGAGQASFNYIAVGLAGRHAPQELVSLNTQGIESTLEINVNPFLLSQSGA